MKIILSLTLLTLMVLTVPLALAQTEFDHEVHGDDAEMVCADCHSAKGGGLPHVALMPAGTTCLDCHDEEILSALPERPLSHLGDYRVGHQFDASGSDGDCTLCHLESESCTMCHHGENVDFLAHDRNWLYEHPLISNKGLEDCATCHDTESYCTDCHVGLGIKPANHLAPGWSQPSAPGGIHADEGRSDLGSCTLCHDGLSPGICAGCHPGMGD
jgi:hypothetical protein